MYELLEERRKRLKRERDRRYRQTERGKESNRRHDREWQKRNPDKKRAQRLVQEAIKKGQLVPQPCKCGVSEDKVHGHHHKGYTNPLDVEWLCHECHVKAHQEEVNAVTERSSQT